MKIKAAVVEKMGDHFVIKDDNQKKSMVIN